MRYLNALRDPFLAAFAWAILALCTFALREGGGATILVWAPSGLAVAAFQATPRAKWPLMAAVFAPVQIVALWFGGTELSQAIIFALASLVQAIVAAGITIRLLGGHDRAPTQFRHVLGMFIAALVGCKIGAALTVLSGSTLSSAEVGWWFLANLLGILLFAPLFTYLREKRKARAHWSHFLPSRKLALPLAAIVLGSAAILAINTLLLLPLLFAGAVAITVRHGQLSSTLAVLAFCGVATVISLGGSSPAPLIDMPALHATLILQGWMAATLATALPIAAMLHKRDEMQQELLRRNSGMHESLMMLDLAEQLAGIGRWQLNLETGERDWSPRMLEMHGLSPNADADPGGMQHLLPDGGDYLYGKIEENAQAREPYSFDLDVVLPSEGKRILRNSILNEFDMHGNRVALFGVAMDVTDQISRVEALDKARDKAVRLANEARHLANTDPLTNLPNRRCTFARLEAMVEVAHQQGSPLTAIMLDIDHFKAVNDTYGHQTGDEVIVQVAELSRRQARQGDVVGRIGGEEFVWLLPGITAMSARALAERLRESVERGNEGSFLPNITISVGVAQLEAGNSGEQLLARADAALYEAKESGRNQVRRAA